MRSRNQRTIRFALVFSCLMALIGAQVPGGTSQRVGAQSKGDDELRPEVVFPCNNCPISIPSRFDQIPTPASPYPANISVSGLTGGLTSISVTITGWTGNGFDELHMILVSPGANGRAFAFLDDIGGGQTSSTGFTVADSGATQLPDGPGVVNGTTYRPADHFSCTEAFVPDAGLPATVHHASGNACTGAATFNTVFDGLSGTGLNGTWKVYIVDDEGCSLLTGGITDPACTDTITSISLDIVANGPTAADSMVSGTITDDNGSPVAGTVVNLSGSQNRRTITNGKGQYQFDQVEASGFYTVTPSRANYSFSPANRSFSQLGNHTDAAFSGSSSGDNLNPLDTPEFFVRQQYLDVLGREPDEGGFNYWSNEITNCGINAACVNQRRRDVAAAFFIEDEFQKSGSYIYDAYKGSLGRKPLFSEYSDDRRRVVGGPNLDTQKAAFADSFVQRAEFVTRYQGNTTATSFVDALLATASQSSGVDLSSQRATLINEYNNGGSMNQSRSLVLQELADNAALKAAEYNAAFVLTEYFSYLQRNPEPEGYDFWLNVVNNGDIGNYRGMVCSFVTSTEYQKRFSAVVTHNNGECGN